MKTLKHLGLLLAAALLLSAADEGPKFVPSASTTVVGYTVRLKSLHLANTTASAVTVVLSDRSTNCNAGVCQIWPTVSIAANSVYVADLKNIPANSGFTWQASAANAVVGWVDYN